MSRSWFISLQQVLRLKKLTFIGGKFDRCIHAWICKFYSCILYKNCIEKLFKLSEPLLFVQCWIYERRKGKQGIMFCLRPGLTSEWSVFKKLCNTVVCVFTFAECSPSPRRKLFSFHNTDPRDIISLLFMPPKEGLYWHASLFFSSEFISLHWT